MDLISLLLSFFFYKLISGQLPDRPSSFSNDVHILVACFFVSFCIVLFSYGVGGLLVCR